MKLIRKNSRFVKLIISVVILVLIVACLKGITDHEINHEETYKGKAVGDKIALIIPGLNEAEDRYKKIEEYYTDVGITPVFIDINWIKFNINDLLEYGNREINTVLRLYPNRDVYFFGFSLGSVIALLSSKKYEAKGSIICSLSPLFRNDFNKFPNWFKSIMSLPNYISINEESTVFLYGDHDNSIIRSDVLVKKREKLYSKSKFKMIRGAKHDISGQAYLEQIKQEIYELKRW